MKLRVFFSFLAFLTSIPVLQAKQVTPEELAGLLRSADTVQSVSQAQALAWSNLETLVQVLEIRSGDALARTNALNLLQNASFVGRFDHKRFFSIFSNQLFNIRKYTREVFFEDERKQLKVLMIYHGYAPNGMYSLPLLTNFFNLKHMVSGLHECKGLSASFSVPDSFFSSGKKLIEARNFDEFTSFLGKLKTKVEDEVTDPDARDLLLAYLQNLVSQAVLKK